MDDRGGLFVVVRRISQSFDRTSCHTNFGHCSLVVSIVTPLALLSGEQSVNHPQKLEQMMKFRSSSNGNRIIRRLYCVVPGIRHLTTSTSTSTSTKGGNHCCCFSSFLVNTLGFTKHQSLSTSAKLAQIRQGKGMRRDIELDIIENANSVIEYFNQIGFEPSHIRKIVSREPVILVSRVNQTLKPKIKTLNELGITTKDLIQAIVNNPSLLRQRLSPGIRAFRTVLGSDDRVVTILKHSIRLYFNTAAQFLIPNVVLLQTYCGTPSDRIQRYILSRPKIFIRRTDLFRNLLFKVEYMLGIPRHSKMFLYGIQLLSSLSDKNVVDKCEMFKSFGWTHSQVMELIGRNPMCLTSAEAKIKERLDLLMNQLGYKPSYLASQPGLFTYSVQKRLLPRHRVLQVLKEKGLLRMNYPLGNAAVLAESRFLEKFVLPFEDVHQVYALHTGSMVGLLTTKS